MTIKGIKGIIWALCAVFLAAAVLVCLPGKGNRTAAHERVSPVSGAKRAPEGSRPDCSAYVKSIAGGEPVRKGTVSSLPIGEDPSAIFRLVSVFLVESGAEVRGFAAIVYRNEETLYAEMAALPENYILESIASDSVVLEKEGKRWSLDRTGHVEVLPTVDALAEPEKPVEKGVVLEIADLAIDEPEKIKDPSGAPGERYEIPAEAVDVMLKNTHKLIHDIEIKFDVSRADGKMVGVKVFPKEYSLPFQLGLRDGDVVRAVNGKLLKSMSDVMNIYQTYGKDPPEKIKLLVERKGRIIVKEYVTRGRRGP
jgi:type II secretory pathway component PulC